jgi:hypothetical protein
MHKAIFTRVIQKTNKKPKRVKTSNGGMPIDYLYQDGFSEWENHAVACQNFCKINNIDSEWHGALVNGGMVFITLSDKYCVDEFTIFEFEEENKNEFLGK